jgi:hypothetical protein
MNQIFKTLLIGLALGISSQVFSQTYDTRLEPYYSQEEIQKMIREDVSKYKFLVNCLNKAIYIAEIPAEKADGIKFNGTLAIDPNGKHTYLSLGLTITEEYQYYKIEGTNKMLVVMPKIFLENK